MGADYEIRPPTREALQHILANLRDADATEVAAVVGKNDPLPGVEDAIRTAELSGVAYLSGEPVLVFGFTRYPGRNPLLGERVLNAWMLVTDGAFRLPVSFMRHIHLGLEAIDSICDLTYCGVWEKNTVARKWLARIGYAGNRRYVVGGIPFIILQRRRK